MGGGGHDREIAEAPEKMGRQIERVDKFSRKYTRDDRGEEGCRRVRNGRDAGMVADGARWTTFLPAARVCVWRRRACVCNTGERELLLRNADGRIRRARPARKDENRGRDRKIEENSLRRVVGSS